MKNSNCPNIETCQLVIREGFIPDEGQREKYIKSYCMDKQMKWNSCRRFIVNNEIKFCPDFVLPDSTFTVDEVIDIFDQENE